MSTSAWVRLKSEGERVGEKGDIPWDRESVREEIWGVSDRRFEVFLENFIAFLVLVAGFAPLGDGFAVQDEDGEEGVEEVRLD